MTTLAASNSVSLNREFLFKIRTRFPFGIYNKHSFMKKVTEGRKFYSVTTEPGRNPNSEIEILTFIRSQEYSGPKSGGKDSFICFVEYSTGERLGSKKEGFIIDELFFGANAIFLVDDEEEAFAENDAHGYSSLLGTTWKKLWTTEVKAI